MEKYYKNADEEHVAAFVVYGNNSNHKLYADAEFTKYLDPLDVFRAQVNSQLLILDAEEEAWYRPVTCNRDNNTGYTFTIVVAEENSLAFATWVVAVDPEA